MNASHSFIVRHSVTIHLTAWSVFFVSLVLDGYLDLPAPFSVPFSAYVVLIGAPFVILTSVASRTADISQSKSLQKYIRMSPWLAGGWWCFTVFLFVAELASNAQMRSLLYQR
jgi:hypothetical protein